MPENVQRDIHILKYLSSFITVSEGRVIYVTDPSLAYCPLASHLYTDFKKIENADKVIKCLKEFFGVNFHCSVLAVSTLYRAVANYILWLQRELLYGKY